MGLSFIHALVREAKKSGAAAELIFERADACQISPVLMFELQNGEISGDELGLDEGELNRVLLQFKLKQTAKVLFWKRAAAAALDAISMPAIILKGAPLAKRLWQNEIWRQTNDIDIWIAQKNVDAAVQSLEKMGYRKIESTAEWATNQVLLEHECMVPIELHWKLVPSPWIAPEFGEAFERSVAIHELNDDARMLCDEDLWIHLLLHAHQHYFALKTMVDCFRAKDLMAANPENLARYGLNSIDRVIREISDAFTPNAPASLKDDAIRLCARLWYKKMLGRTRRGELIFGETSAFEAAIGVLLRAASMALLDENSLAAAENVILDGPHCIGRVIHRVMNKD